MNKNIKTIFLSLILLITIGLFAIPNQAEANFATGIACLISATVCGVVDAAIGVIMVSFFAELGNLVLTASSWFLSVAGIILNISIILTMNIKTLYELTPAIGQVWIVIRNISSMFIIFGLLYSSILTILDMGKPDLKRLIGNIIMAGLLINFSLFFTKALVDVSNMVSIQIYRAIAPEAKVVNLTKENFSSLFDATFTSNGLANNFLQGLRINTIWENKKGLITGVIEKDYFNIFISTVAGSALIIMAAFSFFAAAIAFIIRIVVLLLLMAFSPVYFAGIVFPQVKSTISGKWEKWLEAELIFMPAYLIMMYVAMKFISGGIGDSSSFITLMNNSAKTATAGTAVIIMSMVGLLLQFTIAFILINIPLIVAGSLGGKGMKWGVKAKDWASGLIGGTIGRNTVGRAARLAGKQFDAMAVSAQSNRYGRAASTVLRTLGISQAVRGKLEEKEKSKYGGRQSLGDIEKENKDRSKVITGMQRFRDQMSTINSIIGSSAAPSASQLKSLRSTLGKFGNNEFDKIDFDTIKNPTFMANLTSQQADKLFESDMDPKKKEELKEIRKKQLNEIFEKGSADIIKEHMQGLSGKELSKLSNNSLSNSDVIDNIAPSQLKEMGDLDAKIKIEIAGYIKDRPKGTHKSTGYIKANLAEWGL